MLNKYPLWKYILILAVLAVGLIYSAPNLYPDDPGHSGQRCKHCAAGQSG